jgi:hypothetical protein
LHYAEYYCRTYKRSNLLLRQADCSTGDDSSNEAGQQRLIQTADRILNIHQKLENHPLNTIKFIRKIYFFNKNQDIRQNLILQP